MKFGECPLYGKDDEIQSAITVSQFILIELQNDELEFQNLLYKNIFEEYYKLREAGQQEIQKNFTNHQDPKVVEVVTSILIQEHNLNIKQFVAALVPEENVLSMVVPKAIMVYKAKITAIAYQELREEMIKLKPGDDLRQTELLGQLQTLMNVRNQLSKELNRLTI
jgi:DNA primase